MRFVGPAVLVSVCFACTKSPCPDDARITGAAPPDGLGQVCKRPDGTKHGASKEWYKSGQLDAEGHWSNGKRVKQWLFYHENGKLADEVEFDNGLETGLGKSWYKNGQLRFEGAMHIVDNQTRYTGIHRHMAEDGSLQKTCDHQGSKSVCKFPNGSNESIGSYVGTERSGLWTEWYANGNKKSQGEWLIVDKGCPVWAQPKCSVQNGEWFEWYENGQMRSHGTYKDQNPLPSSRRSKASRKELDPFSDELGCYVPEPRSVDGRDGLWRDWNPAGVLIEQASYRCLPKCGVLRTGSQENLGGLETCSLA